MNSSYFDNKELFTGPKTSQYGSHMVMTNVAKELKVKHINIDTKFRDEYNSNTTTNYNITLPQKVNEVKNMSVTNVELPMTFYNISENLGNNSMKIKQNTTFKQIVIPDGQYTQSSLVTAVAARFSALSITDITFAIPVNTNKTTITTSSTTPYIIEFDVDSTGNFAKYNFKFRLGWLLGFRQQSYTLSPSQSMTSECLVDLSGPRYLYLVIDEFTGTGNQNSFVSPLPTSLINKNVLARIPISLQIYPFMSVYPFHRTNGLLSDVRSYSGKVDIQKLNVQLVNENGIVMDLNGADFSFCLRLEHE
jgi:7-cyano-7-deazaguanine synthase in queuosine biosynthesis